MVSKFFILRDHKLRENKKENLLNYLFVKTNMNNCYYIKPIYYYFFIFIHTFGQYTKIKNYCVLSYRRRGVFNFFRLTRMMFKQYALNKQLVGIMKSSW
jgi:ribosomal protein S14